MGTKTPWHKFSICSVVGLTNPKTMKMKGEIGEQEVIVMIESRAMNNFISLTTVDRLNIPIFDQ